MRIGALILTALACLFGSVTHEGDAGVSLWPTTTSSSHFSTMSGCIALMLGAMTLRRRRSSREGAEPELDWERAASRAEGVGAWRWNAESGAVTLSRDWSQMLGLSVEQFSPHQVRWEELLHSQDVSILERHLRSCLGGHEDKFSMECRCRHTNGQCVFLLMRGAVVRDELGHAAGCCGTAFDISDYKVSESRTRRLSVTSKMLSSVMEAVIHAENEEDLLKDVIGTLMESECYESVKLKLLGHEGAMPLQAAASKYVDVENDGILLRFGERVIQTGEMVSECEEVAGKEEGEGLVKLCRVAFPKRDWTWMRTPYGIFLILFSQPRKEAKARASAWP